MKKFILALGLVAFSTASMQAQSSKWSADNSHSNVKFSVTHMVISEVEGSIKNYTIDVTSPSADFNGATVSFTGQVNSISTDDAGRDKHLMAEDFFNVEKYPTMTFTSTSFKKVKDNMYQLTGNLTMRGVTKTVSLDVLYGGTKNDPWGNTKAGFKIRGKINRQDFGLNWKKTTEAGDMVVSDDVSLAFNVELVKAK